MADKRLWDWIEREAVHVPAAIHDMPASCRKEMGQATAREIIWRLREFADGYDDNREVYGASTVVSDLAATLEAELEPPHGG